MDENKLLGLMMILVGFGDIILGRVLAAKLAPAARTLLATFGAGFLLVGAALAFGYVKVI